MGICSTLAKSSAHHLLANFSSALNKAASSPPIPAKSTPAIPLHEQGFDADRDQDDAADDRGLVPQLHAEMPPEDQRNDAA